MIDLHLHSSASDGLLNPAELVSYAKSRGITVCALTDHDTMDGVAEAMSQAEKEGVTCLAGIELSCSVAGKSLHLLGYFRDAAPAVMAERLVEIQQWRAERNPKMVAKLQMLGINITMDDVREEANGGILGRPHIARVMVKRSIVKTPDEAFDKYLGYGKPAYVEKKRLSLEDAVALVHRSGGAAILAHPLVYHFMKPTLLSWILQAARDAGADGAEAFYPEHKTAHRRRIIHKCEELGLLVTGGSDFHGPRHGMLQPGIGTGDLLVPAERVEPLLQCIERRQKAIA